VKIAILDEGVDTRHPDLDAAIAGAFDATDGDSFQDPNAWDGHGTCCAGLAAAIAKSALGVRGAGAGCSILAIRIAYSQTQGGPWVTSNEKIARAISWSWQNGADVLSNSWGGGAPSNDIAEEFEELASMTATGVDA
jgi:subtilisin family serine protease